MESLCGLFGYSRQAYYQNKRTHQQDQIKETQLCQAVKEIRESDGWIGALKLHVMLKDIFGEGQMLGRDSFFRLLRRKRLMLKPKRGISTTNSNHRYRTYKNLIKGFTPMQANQLWVCDITYIKMKEETCYLHLVTDAYSHMIVGWFLSESLHATNSLKALEMALKQAQESGADLSGLIHHSDRGCQYCSDMYVHTLKSHEIHISMTEDSNPTDNAIAERANGIVKQSCSDRLNNSGGIEVAREIIGSYIRFYNAKRPHMSIEMRTPKQAHQMTGALKKRWKKREYLTKGKTNMDYG